MILPRPIEWTDRSVAKRDLMANDLVAFMLTAGLLPMTMIARLVSGIR